MEPIQRKSPVLFRSRPVRTETRDHWNVVLEYEGEGKGPYLVDLSHRFRWDIQDSNLSSINPWGLALPENPNQCRLEEGSLFNRMNRTQAAAWHLRGERPEPLQGTAFTEVTDATVFLALAGQNIFSITEKLSALDLADPSKQPPFLMQGPFSHVPSQLVVLERSASRSILLFTCSRGYAHDMVHAVLDAGEEFGLRPAGENAFTRCLEAYLRISAEISG